MNSKISVFIICVKMIIYMLLYNSHDFTFSATYLDIFFIVNHKILIDLIL